MLHTQVDYDTLPYMGVAEMARRIQAREFSSLEVVSYFLDRIRDRDPSLGAFVHIDPEGALSAARLADNALLSGHSLGALHGVPTAIKDLFGFYPGWPSTYGGVSSLADHVVDQVCLFARRVENAGGIVVGKTNSPVLGFRGTCDNELFGPTRNPFNVELNAGGSSGGAAAAVADGLLPFAQATDGGGSIRIPAAWCGLVGFRPTPGLVPLITRPSAFAGVDPFIFDGVVTRSVEDAALCYDTLTGASAMDPFSLMATPELSSYVNASLQGARVAFTPDFGTYPVERGVLRVVEEAVTEVTSFGCELERPNLGLGYDHQELTELWCRLMAYNNIGFVEEFRKAGLDFLGSHRPDLPEAYAAYLDSAYVRTPVEVLKDQIMRTRVFDAIEQTFGQFDFIISPTLACSPVANAQDGNTVGPSQINGEPVNPLIGWCLTYLTNFTGHPSMSVPAGLDRNGMPVGLQIIGRRHDDRRVLALAAAFERARPWDGFYDGPAARAIA